MTNMTMTAVYSKLSVSTPSVWFHINQQHRILDHVLIGLYSPHLVLNRILFSNLANVKENYSIQMYLAHTHSLTHTGAVHT